MVDSEQVERAASVLASGGLVGLPTETVYGLAADATNPVAVRRVFAVKGRPADHPLIVHVASPGWLEDIADDPSDAALRLAAAFWPGPLTVVVRRAVGTVASAVTGGRATLAVRSPDHPVALAVIEHLGRPVAAPSANRFGRVSPTTAADVERDLGSDVDLVLDGGRCAVGVESTIVDCSAPVPEILRPGSVSPSQVSEVTGHAVRISSHATGVPGTLDSHYSPTAVVVVCEPHELEATAQRHIDSGAAVGVIGSAPKCDAAVVLGDPENDDEYAHGLYRWLRAADGQGLGVVVAALPVGRGIGSAVRDRLVRASHARTASDR